MDLNRIEYVSLSFFGLSVVIDQVTTVIGLSRGLVEGNTFTRYLMETGTWIFIDLAICVCLVLFTHLFIKHTRGQYKFALLFPLITGFIRLLAGISNISLII